MKKIKGGEAQLEKAEQRKRKLKEKKKKFRFIGLRAWFSVFISHLYPDIDNVTDKIGNKIFIGNNVVVTKNSKTALLLITDLGLTAPRFFPSKLENQVKRKFKDVRIDFAYKTQPYAPNMRTGLESRVQQWTKTIEKGTAPEKNRRIAERCLYTVHLLKSKVPLFRVRPYIQIRVGESDKLQDVIDEVHKYLGKYGITYKDIKSNIDIHLQYIAMCCKKEPKNIKDIPWIICSLQTLAEISPNSQGINDAGGMILGTELMSMQPYMIDWHASAGAKNVYIQAPSGEGKTFIAQNWCQEARAINDKICIRDIKGNEFTGFTEACNGVIVDLGPKGTQYVNMWRWDATTKEDPKIYTNRLLTLVKRTMMILAKVKVEEEDTLGIFVDEFLKALYTKIGASRTNKNTWYRTETLTPYTMYTHLEEYISLDMKQIYGKTLKTAFNNWSTYFSPHGTNSHAFRDEIRYEDFINTDVLTFTFDMLSDTSVQDEALYKVKILFSGVLEDEYIMHNKALGFWTMIISEESSIAADFVLQEYVKNFLLRRAQNVYNVMLGNSLSALLSNPAAKGLIDTINMLVIGGVNAETREYLVKQYDLSPAIQERLKKIKDKQTYESVFVIVNMLQKKPVNGLLKIFVPKSVVKSKVFKGVDVHEKRG